MLSLTADLGINTKITGSGESSKSMPAASDITVQVGLSMEYSITLPGYTQESSRYEWQLKAYRPHRPELQIIASHLDDQANIADPNSSLDYDTNTTTPTVSFNEKLNKLVITGAISLHENHGIHALKLEISYWPDKSDIAGLARLITIEDKLI